MDDKNAPATKGDLSDLKVELKGDIAGLNEKIEVLRSEVSEKIEVLRSEVSQKIEVLRSEVSHGYNDIVERIDDGKTELLKAFYSYATGNNKRVAELEGNEGAFRSRLATIEDRILEVEKRLNIPPAA